MHGMFLLDSEVNQGLAGTMPPTEEDEVSFNTAVPF